MDQATLLTGDSSGLAELAGRALDDVGDSIFAEIEGGLIENPDGVALCCPHQRPNELKEFFSGEEAGDETSPCLSLTYSQLHQAALTLAKGLQFHDIRPGCVILVLAPNSAEVGLLLWTCAVARLTFSAIDTSLLERNGSAVLADLEPSVVVVSGKDDDQRVVDELIEATSQHRQQWKPPKLRISLDTDHHRSGWVLFRRLAEDGACDPGQNGVEVLERGALESEARDRDDPHRIHSVMFTSGTSAGRPKGCPQTVRSTVHLLRSQAWLIEAGNKAGSRVLVQAHNSRAIAPALMLQTWRAGGTVLMPRVTVHTSFSLQDLIDGVSDSRATFVVVSPALVHALGQRIAVQSRPSITLHSVRGVQLGGDVVMRGHLAKCAALFPHAKVCINHGMSEGGGFFTWPFFDAPSPAQVPCFGELCPIGVVAPGARIRIWDPVCQNVARRGVLGELHVCCASIITQYLGGLNGDAFYHDTLGRRWLVTGDQAMIDQSGLVFIVGRSKDTIRRAGITIVTVAIESCVEKYANTQACVVLAAHPTADKQLFAIVRAFNGRTEQQIVEYVATALGASHALGGVVSLRQLGLAEFPVNATHKIIKRELEDAVGQHLSRATATV
ncbi:hypothetical protein DV735_g5784, partial [Chaetothyriales sp. CBS 134920]